MNRCGCPKASRRVLWLASSLVFGGFILVAGPVRAADADLVPSDVPHTAPDLNEKGKRQADALAYFMSGIFEEESAGPEKALESKRKVLDLDPGCSELAIEVAYEYLRRGEMAEATSVLKDAIAAKRKVLARISRFRRSTCAICKSRSLPRAMRSRPSTSRPTAPTATSSSGRRTRARAVREGSTGPRSRGEIQKHRPRFLALPRGDDSARSRARQRAAGRRDHRANESFSRAGRFSRRREVRCRRQAGRPLRRIPPDRQGDPVLQASH